MKIQINDKYHIETDALNYSLMKKRVNKQELLSDGTPNPNFGKVSYTNEGNWGRLSNLVKGLIEAKIKDEDFSILKDLDDDISEFCTTIRWQLDDEFERLKKEILPLESKIKRLEDEIKKLKE